MGLSGQRYAPAALPPGMTRYPLNRNLGGPQGRSGRVLKTSPPPRFRSPDRPARSELLYRLRYLAHAMSQYVTILRQLRELYTIETENTADDDCLGM
jgi:hypothetical protein